MQYFPLQIFTILCKSMYINTELEGIKEGCKDHSRMIKIIKSSFKEETEELKNENSLYVLREERRWYKSGSFSMLLTLAFIPPTVICRVSAPEIGNP